MTWEHWTKVRQRLILLPWFKPHVFQCKIVYFKAYCIEPGGMVLIMSWDYFSEMFVKFVFAKQCCNHFLTLIFLLCLFNYRHILASFVWSSTPTRTYPSTRRTSLRCTGGRRGMRCLHTSTPSLSQHTAACSKVWQTTSPRLTLCFPCRGSAKANQKSFSG